MNIAAVSFALRLALPVVALLTSVAIVASCTASDYASDSAISDSCLLCPSEMQIVVSFGGLLSELDDKPSAIISDRSGGYFVVPGTARLPRRDSLIPNYSRSGSFLGYLARSGDGPGELRVAANTALSMFFDEIGRPVVLTNQEMSVYTAERQPIATHRLASRLHGTAEAVLLEHGRILVVPHSIYSHVVQRTGDTVRSGAVIYNPDGTVASRPQLEPAASRLFIATGIGEAKFTAIVGLYSIGGDPGQHELRINLYSSMWAVHSRLVYRSPTSSTGMMTGPHIEPYREDGGNRTGAMPSEPGERLSAVGADSSGHLVLAFARGQQSAAGSITGSSERARIVTIDAVQLTVVRVREADGVPISVLPNGDIATYALDKDGAPLVAVWK